MWVFIHVAGIPGPPIVPEFWSVGHYDPVANVWVEESQHLEQKQAGRRVNFLNGGPVH